MSPKIGIIGAMDEEITAYLEHLESRKETSWKIFTLYEGTMHGHEVVIVKSGVGKVFSAMVCPYFDDCDSHST